MHNGVININNVNYDCVYNYSKQLTIFSEVSIDCEINLLKNLHPDNYFEQYNEKWNYVYFIMFVNPYELKGDIYKLADEWYLVRFDIYDRQLLSDKAYYYKCDQIEGLIYFLKKLKDSVWLGERNGSISLMNPM